MTTKAQIRDWLERGKSRGATHLLVVCDTFHWDDYPVFVTSDQDAQEVAERYNGPNMQKLMEVYRLDVDWDEQLRAPRTRNF